MYSYCEAKKRYSPIKLIEHSFLKNDCIIVDKEKVLEKDPDLPGFSGILHHIYGWNFSGYESVSIYLEEKKNEIIGGIINLADGEKLTKRLIVSSSNTSAPYIYRSNLVQEIVSKFSNS